MRRMAADTSKASAPAYPDKNADSDGLKNGERNDI